MTGDRQGRPIQQRQQPGAQQQRPGAAQQAPFFLRAEPQRPLVAPPSQAQSEKNQGQRQQLQDRGVDPPQHAAQGHRPNAGKAAPPIEIEAAPKGAQAKEKQKQDHPDAAAADAEQGSRGAGAADLHADAEEESAKGHGDADRGHRADNGTAEHRALGKERREQKDARRQHDQLGADSSHVLVKDDAAVGAGKAEGCVKEGGAQSKANQDQRRQPAAKAKGIKKQRRRRGQAEGRRKAPDARLPEARLKVRERLHVR